MKFRPEPRSSFARRLARGLLRRPAGVLIAPDTSPLSHVLSLPDTLAIGAGEILLEGATEPVGAPVGEPEPCCELPAAFSDVVLVAPLDLNDARADVVDATSVRRCPAPAPEARILIHVSLFPPPRGFENWGLGRQLHRARRTRFERRSSNNRVNGAGTKACYSASSPSMSSPYSRAAQARYPSPSWSSASPSTKCRSEQSALLRV